MSSRRSKRNTKLGSSRRGTRGLQVNDEKDNEFDIHDEGHTTNQSDDPVLQAQSLSTDHQTSVLECSPHPVSPIHKNSDMEAELPERKRKMGSTRKNVSVFKSKSKLEQCNELRSSEEFGEEQNTQLTKSTMEEEHSYPTGPTNALSNPSQQSQDPGLEGEIGVSQVMVAFHHPEISSNSQTTSPLYDVRSDMLNNLAKEQSIATKESLLCSTSQKRKLGSTRRLLGGHREGGNRENLEVQELLRNRTEGVWKAEVKSSNEAEFSILEEMMQTWEDVKRTESPTNMSHTQSDLISNQPSSSERTEELNVSVGTETSQPVACLAVASTKPPHETLSNHKRVYKFGLETNSHNEDFDMCQDVIPSSPNQSENQALKTDCVEEDGFRDAYQNEPNSKHDVYTSEDCRYVTLGETIEELCRNEPKIISSMKQDIETDKPMVKVEEPLSSLCPLDGALKEDNHEIPTDVPTAESGSISDTLESNSTPEMDSTSDMGNSEPDSHRLMDDKNKTLLESSSSGQEMKKDSTKNKRLENKVENVKTQTTDEIFEQEINSVVQYGKTRMDLDEKPCNVSGSSLSFENHNLANPSLLEEHLHNVNLNSLLPGLSQLSCDVISMNKEEPVVSLPEAVVTENPDIYVEVNRENDVIETPVTCDVTVNEIYMDVKNFTEQSIDLQFLGLRENESLCTKTGLETDPFEIKDRKNFKDNDYMKPIFKDEEENGKKKEDFIPQIQSSPSPYDADEESYDLLLGASKENSEEIFLNSKSVCLAFDEEEETCEKYKEIKDLKESEGHERMGASSVSIHHVTNPLIIQGNDIRSNQEIDNNFSDINLEALHASDAGKILSEIDSGLVLQDAVNESPLESNTVPEKSKNRILPEEFYREQKKDGDIGVVEKLKEQNDMIDHNMKQMILSDNEEHKMTETMKMSTQKLYDANDKAVCHEEISLEQWQRTLNVSQTQDGLPEYMLKSEAEELFLSANIEHTFDVMKDTNDESKEMEGFRKREVADDIPNVSIQDNESKPDLQTENHENKKVLTEKQNYTSTDIHYVEHDENISAASSLLFGYVINDSEESHTISENHSKISEVPKKEKIQSKLNPLVHKRKMGSTRRGYKGQRKHREQDDESEAFFSEGKPTEERWCDMTESQTTTNINSKSHENDGDVESVQVARKAHLEIQTENKMFDSTVIEERTDICDVNVLIRPVEFVGDEDTGKSIVTIKSDFLQNNPTDANQVALKASENPESVSIVIDCGLDLQDAPIDISLESNTVPEKTENSIIPEDFPGVTSHSNDANQEMLSSSKNVECVSAMTYTGGDLQDPNSEISLKSNTNFSPVAHKRKMGSTRRTLRGNQEQRKLRDQDDDTERESHVIAEDVERVPVEGDTEVQTENIIKEGPAENICDDNVELGQVMFVGEKLADGNKMTTNSGFLQNHPSSDSIEEALKLSENVESVSDVTDTCGLLTDVVLVRSEEKTGQKCSPLVHKQKLESYCRPHQAKKEKINSAEGKEDGGSEGVEEEIVDLHSESQDRNKVKDNMIQIIDERENEEHETVRRSTQELCDETTDEAEGHAEIVSDQQQRSSSSISQTQNCPQQDDSENMIKIEMDAKKQKYENESTIANIEETCSLEDIDTEYKGTSQTHQQLLIQTIDVEFHDYIQKVKIVNEEREVDEFIKANTEHAAFDSENETCNESKVIEDLSDTKRADELTYMNIQDIDSQAKLQIENPEQNKMLTERKDTISHHINLQGPQETELAGNVSAVIDSGISFGDSGVSHTKPLNTSEIQDDSQKEEKQSKLNPSVHKRKMGSTRRSLKGHKEQSKQREQNDESEILKIDGLITEDKEQKKELSEGKNAGPVEELDSTLMTSSYNAEKSTEESLCDITKSQTKTYFNSMSHKNSEDVERVPVKGDTEAFLEIQTENKMFDSTVSEERSNENIFDENVLMRQVEFVGDEDKGKIIVTTKSDFLQNNPSTDANQDVLRPSENPEIVSCVIDCGLDLQNAPIDISIESNTVPEKIQNNIIPEDIQGPESNPNLNPVVHKRKMGSTRRLLRGNKGQRKHIDKDDDTEKDRESHENTGDAESVSAEEDTEGLTVIEKRTDIHDEHVLLRKVKFVENKVTGESDVTIESDFLQNIPSSDPNQDGLKSSEDAETVSTVIDSGVDLQNASINSPSESKIVPKETEMSMSPNDFEGTVSLPNLSPVVHKRKMGSTRRLLRGNKDKDDLRKVNEDMEPHIEEQNDVMDHNMIQQIMNVRQNVDETPETMRIFPICDKDWYRENIVIQEQQSSSNTSQTQAKQSQDDAYENVSEAQEKALEFKDSPLVLTDVLLLKETQIHGSSEVAVTVGSPQTEDKETNLGFCRSVNKRKIGSTRKTQREQSMGKEIELGEDHDGETKKEPTSENFSLEELISLTITGTQGPKQQTSVALESHDNENTKSKLDKQTGYSEQTKILQKEQNDSNSKTNQAQSQNESEIINSGVSQTENRQTNPTVQKRKMGSTRKTLRGNNGQRRQDVEPKEMDGGERISQEHLIEFKEFKAQFDDNKQLKDPTDTSKEMSEAKDGMTNVSINQTFVSDENLTKNKSSEVPSEALNSEALAGEGDLNIGDNDDPSPSETGKVYISRNLEVKSEHQVQLTVLDQSHESIHSEKHLQSETVAIEKRRKIGSTRKNIRRKGGQKLREESKQFSPGEDRDGETSIVRNAERDSLEESEGSLLREIERALNNTSQSSQNIHYQLKINEPNLANTTLETCHFNTPENSEFDKSSDKAELVSLQVSQSQNQSEISSPGRRRKMGSTRRNPRQQAKRDDESKDDEEDENKQEPKSLKMVLEAVEESKVHDSRDQEGNNEYIDVPVSCQESANSTSREGTSPSARRKFGSRRINIGKRDLDGSVPPESKDDIMEDTSAQLVSLDQMIKASQHDKRPGNKQTVDLKNTSDMEVIPFNVVMVGNSCVGKTSFIKRIHGGQFSPDYCSTIGVDTCVQNVVLDDRVAKLQIWDTAGQERFHSITTQVFHRAHGLLLMYEITSSKSFISLRDWVTKVREKAPDDVIMMLLGNKNDCAGREVQVQEGEAFAREYKMHFMECSAATGDNVSECMKSLAEILVQKKSRKMEGNVALKKEQPRKKSGCC